MKHVLFTIFGATGNLMYKKLLPALYHLKIQNRLPEDTKIICIGRKDFTTESYIEDARSRVNGSVNWDVLGDILLYYKMEITNSNDYTILNEYIKQNCAPKLDAKIFYLSTAPNFFPIIAKGISDAGLVSRNDGISRVIFEKPFGEDLSSAKMYNELMNQYFDESQIYRIDHYLGKEMIRNILVVRFANRVFEDIWSNKGIESVKIVVKETEGILSRGEYYDAAGALRDMVQSHMMQMISLIAMEPPMNFDTDELRDEKVKVIDKLSCCPMDLNNIIIGQYKGYLQEKNVKQNSSTETFVFIKAKIDNERWSGVPFYLITGKKLDEKKSEIVITFKDNSSAYKKWKPGSIMKNQLIIRVAPNDGISFQINTKLPGLQMDVAPTVMDYCHSCQAIGNLPEAYERLILDMIEGNTIQFTRWDEIETSWKFIDDIKTKSNLEQKSLILYETYQELANIIEKEYGVKFE
ncbi:MAG TPA: glucose-6-phosphate dehydrogenase [Bacilli bacterium]|nr:glucose-6-phosphate dehydrogenase [Bacilli bacterium]